MAVWYCIPSARPADEAEKCLSAWRKQGYKIALLVDWNPPGQPLQTRISKGDIMLCGGGRFAPKFSDDAMKVPYPPDARTYPPNFNEYPGYAKAVNALVAEVMAKDPGADWLVTGGDDVYPDPNHTADEIAAQCSDYFRDDSIRTVGLQGETFGVMQPTGDPYGEKDPWPPGTPADRRTYASRVCGSPWLGREWCLRGNQGQGPFHPGFYHMHGDQCLQEVAEKLGILWQRPDLTHYHNHWARKRQSQADMPEFLRDVNSMEHWRESKALLDRLRGDGFRECLPLESEPIA